MNVPKLPFLEKKNSTEYFLSLVLRDEKTSAVIFQEINGRINVVGEHEEQFKTSLEDSTEDELLEVLDKAVSTAEKNLPPDAESHKTIFGVKRDWIENEKIKKDYLVKLKKISDELDFKPVGFLVISEAISHLLQIEEGAPVSAILVEVGQIGLTVSLFKAGKIVETKSGPIEGSLTKTTETLLKHFSTAEILPSRIILFDGGREKLQQEFLAHKWSKDLPFLHPPQVMNLPANFDARAVLNGAATQMGFEVLEGSLAHAEKADKEPVIDALNSAVMSEEDKTLAEAAKDFGFEDTDIKKKDEAVALPDVKAVPKTAIDENLTNANISKAFGEIPEEVKINESDTRQFPSNAMSMTASMKGFLGKLHFGKLLQGAAGSRKRLLLIVVPIAIIILLLGVFIFGRSATVTLGINGKDTDKTETVTFSQSDTTDASSNTIAAKFIKVSEDGKISTSTTGKKETGDKAKGTVTIFNNSDSGITLPTGTVVKSDKDLNFLTDKPVTVASASGDVFSGTDPGKANVAVTAEKFGTNYNIPSSTKFSVDGRSSVAAKNDNAFSGGTKKDIKVVAKADQDKLLKDLQKQKEQDAKDEINKKAGGDSKVLPSFLDVSYDRKSFSKDVGDEATDISLTGTISYTGVSYRNSDLVLFAKDKLKDSDGKLEVDEKSVEVESSNLKEKGDNASAKLKIKAKLVPKFDQSEIANQIKGKSTKDAIELLNQVSEVNKVDIKVFPPLPILGDSLPFSAGKIKLVIQK